MEIGIKLEATIKNHVFYSARIKKGYVKFVDFVEQFNDFYGMNIAYGQMNSYENMQNKPHLELSIKIADFLDVPVERLFPLELNNNIPKKLRNLNKKIYLIKEAKELMSGYKEDGLLLESSKNELRDKINESLSSLDDREQKIIKARFYNNQTLEECAKIFKISGPRVREIEAKALRKLRHPSRSSELKEFLTY